MWTAELHGLVAALMPLLICIDGIWLAFLIWRSMRLWRPIKEFLKKIAGE